MQKNIIIRFSLTVKQNHIFKQKHKYQKLFENLYYTSEY